MKTFLIACCMLLSSYAFSQDIYYQVAAGYWNSPKNCRIQTTNIGFTTSQTISPGVTNSWTNTSPAGYYTNPLGLFSFGSYWVVPTIFHPMAISVNAGYSALINNLTSVPTSIKMGLTFYTSSGIVTWFYGPSVTVPANGSATAVIPAGAYTYTATPTGAYPGNDYPVPVTLWLIE